MLFLFYLLLYRHRKTWHKVYSHTTASLNRSSIQKKILLAASPRDIRIPFSNQIINWSNQLDAAPDSLKLNRKSCIKKKINDECTCTYVCHELNILKVEREAKNKFSASFLAAAHQCGNSIKAYLFPFKFSQRSRLKSRVFMNISHGSDEAANQPKNKKGIKSTRRRQDLPVHVKCKHSKIKDRNFSHSSANGKKKCEYCIAALVQR